jgi:hypothetical protein
VDEDDAVGSVELVIVERRGREHVRNPELVSRHLDELGVSLPVLPFRIQGCCGCGLRGGDADRDDQSSETRTEHRVTVAPDGARLP